MKILKAALVPLILLTSISANSALYTIQDHPDGQLVGNQGPYGLRMDQLDPPSGNGPTFSVETNGASVLLNWDGVLASMTGTMWNNKTNELWDVSQTFTGVSASGAGFIATGGELSLGVSGSVLDTYQLKQDGSEIAFYFQDDSHRCSGHSSCGPWVGNGWVEGSGTNDWLITATEVPVPAAAWLFGSALLGLSGIKRKT